MVEINTDAAATPTTDLEAKIIRQVEYYFGDINYGRDKFLQAKAKESEERWVDLDVLLTFNRLKALSEDKKAICDALAKSTTGLVETQDNGDGKVLLRRSPDMPLKSDDLSFWQEVRGRSCYVKGFPLTFTLDDIMAALEPHATTVNVNMRRTKGDTRAFKGSVFACLKSKADAEALAAKSETITVKDGDTDIPLTIMMQNVYHEKKVKQRQEAKEKLRAEKMANNPQFAKMQERKKKAENRKTAGLLLHLSELPDGANFKEIKDLFGGRMNVAFVEHKDGDKEAIVRFFDKKKHAQKTQDKAANGEEKTADANGEGNAAEDKAAEGDSKPATGENGAATTTAEKTRAADIVESVTTDGVLKLNDAVVKYRVLEGAEEDEFYKRMQTSWSESAKNQAKQRGNNKRDERNSRDFRDRKRKLAHQAQTGAAVKAEGERIVFGDSDDDEGTEAKAPKVETPTADVAMDGAKADTPAVKAESPTKTADTPAVKPESSPTKAAV